MMGQENYTTVLSETGNILLTVAESRNSSLSRIDGLPDKLLVFKTNIDTEVYTLPGLALEHTYPGGGAFGNVFRCILEMSGEKYFQIYEPSGQVLIYNSDHSLWKAINAPKPAGYGYQSLNSLSISEADINPDSAIELIYTLSDGVYLTASIVNENGDTLLPAGVLNSAYISKLPGLPNKLLGDTFPSGLSTNVYSIPSLSLEHAYPSRMKRIKLENSGEKYHTAIADEDFKAYNSDHTLWKTFNLPIPESYSGSFVDLVSETRLSADPLLEVGYSYFYQPDIATTRYESAIINENGNTLLTIPNGSALNLSEGEGLQTKLIATTLMVSGFDGFDFGGIVYGLNPDLGIVGFENRLLKVFPNPVCALLHVTFETPLTLETLYNSSGMPVFKATSRTDIDVSQFPSGLYIFTATDVSGKTYSRKVIVEKR